ncbi:MAG: periplasmic heavy metal sensor [Cyanobacteria bacterium]|nr:periplasmic heavy metal sensor [Cyanobacteriota bacterium]
MVLAAAAPAQSQGFGFKWWQTERFKTELALTQEQINRIEGIYQATEPLLRSQKHAVDRREEKLSRTIQDPKSDEATVVQAIDRLEAARSEISRTRNLMFFRIRRVLSDEQNLKINAMHSKDRADRENREKADREKKGNTKGPRGDEHNHSDCQ